MITQNQLIPVEAFIKSQLALLIAGKDSLTALFATYNSVGGYESGIVKTRKSGLRVFVKNGHMAFNPSDLAGLWIGASYGNPEARLIGDIAVASQESRAVAAQQMVEHGLDLEQDTNVLCIVYTGVTAFKEATDFAVRLKRGNCKTTVVILTCACDLSSKVRELSSFVESGQIDHAVVTHECGGFETMENILEKLVSIWPNS